MFSKIGRVLSLPYVAYPILACWIALSFAWGFHRHYGMPIKLIKRGIENVQKHADEIENAARANDPSHDLNCDRTEKVS